ncbi:MAG: tetratricopeptide repeat protein [Chitinophagales bacterium]|nr:tetratricopeptide repeat protein [Chitinophagales bacterium]
MSTSRQLAAIMFADIQGYTAMMQSDEAKAHTASERFQASLEEVLKHHNGRVIQFNGDGALCLFKSAIEAVKAGIEIQKNMLQEPVIPLRIGIHSGDIVFEGKNIYGDGVNIASRVETFAVAGGVFISGKVYDEIENQNDISAVLLGKFNFKNVRTPVEIFAISGEGLVVPSKKNLIGKGEVVSNKRNIFISIAALMIVLLVAISVYKIYNAPVANIGKSVAVLPFINMSGDPKDEYFSDGITEDILTDLTKIADLKVISRNSIMQYKGTKKTSKQIAEELNVAVLLEGSVQRSGDSVRINTQLIDAKTDHIIWSDQYDKGFDKVFAIQSEVAQKIAAALKAKLSVSEKAQIERRSTENTEAYNLLLQGRYFRQLRGQGNYEKSISYLIQALQLDSNNSQVWAELALSYSDKTDDGYEDTRIGYAKAKAAAEHALSIDDAPAVAHLAMGTIKELYYWDWAGADVQYQQALKLEPGNANVLRYVGGLRETMGKLDEAISYYNKSLELDPLGVTTLSYLGYCLTKAGKLNEAEATYKRMLDFQPNRVDGHESLGEVYILMGKYDLALQEMNKEKEELWRYFGLALAYYAAGKKPEADATLKTFKEKFESEVGYQLAQVYAFRGDKEKAFEYLNRAYIQHDAGLTEMKTDPFLKNLWSDPRWKIFLTQMNMN